MVGRESEIRLFADDCVCYRQTDSTEDTSKLQKDIDQLGKRDRKGGLRFQPVKCNMMQLTTNRIKKINDRSKAVVPVLVLLFVALWFILRGDLLYVLLYVILFLCFSVFLVLRLPHLGKRELILVLFVRLFDLCLFGFVGFLFLLGSGKGCVL